MIPVADGMVVDTESPATKKAQDGVLEFLLINHPLDCPVCDKGGECPLQDNAYAYGPGESRFVEEKRHFAKPIPISDLVLLDRERCILCDRCTRFAKEVAGDPLIHFQQRGNQTEVNTFPDHPFASYFSGNTVQICPVGALTATPYRFKARPWDVEKVESTCTTCAVGCAHHRRVEPQPRAAPPGRRPRPRQLGLAVRQGPLHLRGGRVRGPARRAHARCRRRRSAPSRWGPALTAAADAAARGRRRRRHAHRRARRRPAHQRVGLRLGEAGQGRPRHRQRRLPARRRPARRGRLRPAPGHHRRRLRRRRRGGAARLPTSRRSCRSCSSGCATPCSSTASRSSSWRPDHLDDAAGGGVAALPARRGRPAGRRSLAGERRRRAARRRPRRRQGRARRRRPGSRSCSAGPRSPSPRTPSSTPSPPCTTPARRPGCSPSCAGPTSTAPSTWGCRRGCCPATSPSPTPATGSPRRGARCRRAAGLDAVEMLTAAADGDLDVLVLLGADPIADFPDHDLARRALERATVIAVDTHRTASVELAVGRPARPPGPTRSRAPPPTSRAGSCRSPRRSRRRAPPAPTGTSPPSWPTGSGADLGLESVEGIWDEIEQVAPELRRHHRRRAQGRRRSQRRAHAARPRPARVARHVGHDRQPAPRHRRRSGRRRRCGRGGRHRRGAPAGRGRGR